MTTLPTPLFILLCILAVVGLGAILCTILVALFVALKFVQFAQEERQRAAALN